MISQQPVLTGTTVTVVQMVTDGDRGIDEDRLAIVNAMQKAGTKTHVAVLAARQPLSRAKALGNCHFTLLPQSRLAMIANFTLLPQGRLAFIASPRSQSSRTSKKCPWTTAPHSLTGAGWGWRTRSRCHRLLLHCPLCPMQQALWSEQVRCGQKDS